MLTLTTTYKGADTIMYERLGGGDDDAKQKTLDDIESFSRVGLRTLIVGYKDLTEEEYAAFGAFWIFFIFSILALLSISCSRCCNL